MATTKRITENKFSYKTVTILNPKTKRFETETKVILEDRYAKFPPAMCEYCSKIYPKKRKDQRFCSDICRMKWWIRKQHNGSEQEYGETNCAICGVIFTKTRPWSKYCSEACRNEGRRRALREYLANKNVDIT